jgi:uncharacterized SAM-binding protein YcdF (DUF218 family)
MFFLLSKIVGAFALPSNFLIMIALSGVVLMGTRMARCGRRLTAAAVALLAILGLSPLSNALTLPLEQRFPPWRAGQGEPTGIVVLGGAISSDLSAVRGSPALNDSAERVTIVAELARRFPKARIVFAGGNSALSGDHPDEAQFAVPLFESFGIPAGRIELERNSRNTFENAIMSKALIQPQPGERWLLVTSAMHMPRAVGCFRQVDFPVEPFPVDWRTDGVDALFRPFGALSDGLARSDAAVREWMGLFVYWLTARSSALFPGPAKFVAIR